MTLAKFDLTLTTGLRHGRLNGRAKGPAAELDGGLAGGRDGVRDLPAPSSDPRKGAGVIKLIYWLMKLRRNKLFCLSLAIYFRG